ncbi:zinc finger, C6HC-type containing protein [Tanacetum coccineum]
MGLRSFTVRLKIVLLVDDDGGTVTSSECPHCNRLFCAQCKVTWHSGISCSEYQSLKKDERDPSDLMLRDLAKNKAWNRCPNCNFYVEKISVDMLLIITPEVNGSILTPCKDEGPFLPLVEPEDDNPWKTVLEVTL